MSYFLSKQMKYATLVSINSATFTGSYQLFGSISKPGSIVRIVNNSNRDVLLSDDGSRNCDIVPAGSFVLYDITTNGPENQRYFPQGPLYISGSAGAGSVYLVVLTPGV